MDGPDERLACLVASDGAALLRYAYLLCRDSGRAEDVVQDALVKLLRRWRSVGASDAPTAYARKVITNAYLDWRRLHSSSEVVRAAFADEGEPDRAHAHAERDLMWRLIGTLPPRQRAVIVLRYYEQLPDAEIASCLDCAPATVRSLAARAFATLRENPQLTDLHIAAAPSPTPKEA